MYTYMFEDGPRSADRGPRWPAATGPLQKPMQASASDIYTYYTIDMYDYLLNCMINQYTCIFTGFQTGSGQAGFLQKCRNIP